MTDLKSMRMFLERKKGEHQGVEKRITEFTNKIQDLERDVSFSEQAQTIIQAVARETQRQLEYRVGELVSLAQASVFDDPWQLKLDFVLRRGKTECDLLWSRGEGKWSRDLMYGGAGGESDVAALGLQLAMWSLYRPRSRNVIFLDEPMRNLKGGDLPERGSMMIKEISKGLSLQILMISHIPDQVEGADRVFEFSNHAGISQVVRKGGEVATPTTRRRG